MASFTGERQLQPYGRQRQLCTVRFTLARASPWTAVDKQPCAREYQSHSLALASSVLRSQRQ
eukprot:SAG31_NODE_6717_length_1912_cov_29.734694_1_plen_61_part_10